MRNILQPLFADHQETYSHMLDWLRCEPDFGQFYPLTFCKANTIHRAFYAGKTRSDFYSHDAIRFGRQLAIYAKENHLHKFEVQTEFGDEIASLIHLGIKETLYSYNECKSEKQPSFKFILFQACMN